MTKSSPGMPTDLDREAALLIDINPSSGLQDCIRKYQVSRFVFNQEVIRPSSFARQAIIDKYGLKG